MDSNREEASSFRSEIVLRVFRADGDPVGCISTDADAPQFTFFFFNDELVLKLFRLNSNSFGDSSID